MEYHTTIGPFWPARRLTLRHSEPFSFAQDRLREESSLQEKRRSCLIRPFDSVASGDRLRVTTRLVIRMASDMLAKPPHETGCAPPTP